MIEYYSNTPLYVLTMDTSNSEENISFKKINANNNYYYIINIENQKYVFIEEDAVFPNHHIGYYKKFKVDSPDSIFFTDLNLCKKYEEEKILTSVTSNKKIKWGDIS